MMYFIYIGDRPPYLAIWLVDEVHESVPEEELYSASNIYTHTWVHIPTLKARDLM